MDKTLTRLDKIPIKAKINTLIPLNLAASEPQNNFLFAFRTISLPQEQAHPHGRLLL